MKSGVVRHFPILVVVVLVVVLVVVGAVQWDGTPPVRLRLDMQGPVREGGSVPDGSRGRGIICRGHAGDSEQRNPNGMPRDPQQARVVLLAGGRSTIANARREYTWPALAE